MKECYLFQALEIKRLLFENALLLKCSCDKKKFSDIIPFEMSGRKGKALLLRNMDIRILLNPEFIRIASSQPGPPCLVKC